MTFSAILVVMSKLNVGDLLDGRYRIETPIARGGMSTVYRCIDTRLGRPVAAKVMDDRYIDDPIFRDRFRLGNGEPDPIGRNGGPTTPVGPPGS